jgi:glycosyltransferase involved in cell wall biosynthesis
MLLGGGTDDRSVGSAHALLRLGHRVWMAGPAKREYSQITEQLGIPFVPVKTGGFMLSLIWRLARFMREEQVQIIHARHGRDYWPAILAARLSGVAPRVVLSRHLAKSPGSFFSRRFLLAKCDALVAVSHFVAKVLCEGHADRESENPERHWRAPLRGDLRKIHVVYGGFDMERFKPGEALAQRREWGLRPDDFAFGVVGAYWHPRGKGQPEFLRAAARMRKKAPQARFLIIGRGDMEESLRGLIDELGLSDVARLTGWSQEMPAAMNALDCLVLPQVGTEAIPGVVIEAHACGKPVIASELDGIPEAFAAGIYGQLVPPGAIDELAAAMAKWAGEPPLDLPAREALHARMEAKFSLERAAQGMAELYNQLIGARTPADRMSSSATSMLKKT